MDYAKRYFDEVQTIAKTIDLNVIEHMVQIIEKVKEIPKYNFVGSFEDDGKVKFKTKLDYLDKLWILKDAYPKYSYKMISEVRSFDPFPWF